jgi:hypothetical protein
MKPEPRIPLVDIAEPTVGALSGQMHDADTDWTTDITSVQRVTGHDGLALRVAGTSARPPR